MEQLGHSGVGTTDDGEAARLLRESGRGTFDAVWFGPPVPQQQQQQLALLAKEHHDVRAEAMKCICPSEVLDFVRAAAAAKK